MPPNTHFDHYEIIAPLGKGGMGEVYRARDTRLSREVAIKVLPADFAHDADRLRRFEQEARAASALNHPNIITIHEIGETDATHYIATELIAGETLRAQIERAPLAVTAALDKEGFAAFLTAGETPALPGERCGCRFARANRSEERICETEIT